MDNKLIAAMTSLDDENDQDTLLMVSCMVHRWQRVQFAAGAHDWCEQNDSDKVNVFDQKDT